LKSLFLRDGHKFRKNGDLRELFWLKLFREIKIKMMRYQLIPGARRDNDV
jgi:hypothetical protein